ncbi:AraC family transcriptional regulator [uncultured Desulfuromonas sp.]|uniref:helix-turn-helix transcriptional regulator n=1 Tax=uncultured Desulfuromonas sp. TaxID=181013 RepID=UPI002AAAC265|nr:AraC family transcriptional regulator [uncultured Desulfuromonas sp.]
MPCSQNYKKSTFSCHSARNHASLYNSCQQDDAYRYSTGPLLTQGFRHIPLDRELAISFLHLHSDSGITINYRIENSPIVFNFILAGSGVVELRDTNTNVGGVTLHPGSGSSSIRLKSGSHLTGVFSIPPGITYSSVCIQIGESRLKECVMGDEGRLPQSFCDILFRDKPQPNDSRFFSGLTPAMLCAATATLNANQEGQVGKCFLQAKANELLCLKLFQLMEQSGYPSTAQLSAKDRQNIFTARELLIRNMETPPTIDQLSRQVGINTLKLKQGFKREFGTTVYSYLRQYRMEKAIDLLRRDKKGVAETAYAVGYSNVSHFIAAFRKSYGITPGEFKREPENLDAHLTRG